MTPYSFDIVLVDSLVGKAARGSVRHLQLKDFSTLSATPKSNFNTPSPTTTGERVSCLQPLLEITNDNTPRSDSTTDINMNVGVDEAC